MRAHALWILAPLMLVAPPASAHFHLDAPPQATNQDEGGNPQKPSELADACPSGTATGAVTQVRAGDPLHVQITETTPHGGHYRVSFAADKSAFQFPATTVTSNQCISTTISNPPVLPVLADGLFVHDQNMANAEKVCNNTATCATDVTVPNVPPGNYVLQVIEWMTPHGSAADNGPWGCFYAHCATIQVVEADASIPDGGVIFEDAGSGASSSGASSSSSTSSSSGSSGSSSSSPAGGSSSDSGCGVTSANGASLCAPLLGALAVVRVLRRRKRRSSSR